LNNEILKRFLVDMQILSMVVSLLSIVLNFSPKSNSVTFKRYGDKKAYIYFVTTSIHEAISLIVNARTPHYT